MKNSGATNTAAAAPIGHHANGNGHVSSAETGKLMQSLKRHEKLSPKYVPVMKKVLEEATRVRLEENPGLSLKEAVLVAVPFFPEWYSEELFVEAVSAIAQEWKRCQMPGAIA